MKKFKEFLNESPDNIKNLENGKLMQYHWSESLTKPFNFHPVTSELWIGEYGDSHKICPFISDTVGYMDLKYKGRLWYKQKVISFWQIVEKGNLKWIVNRLEEKLGHSLRGWKLDLYDDIKSPTGDFISDFPYLYRYIRGYKEEPIEKIKPKPRGLKKDKRPLGWKRFLRYESLLSFKEFKLNESPDYVEYNYKIYKSRDEDAYSFAFDGKGRLIVHEKV